MTLYRPVGLKELESIAASGYRTFPARLPHQSIFYPVLSPDYAQRIARDWNPYDDASGYAGFVTRFDVDDGYVGRFEIQTAGSHNHRELWVPAEELKEFNRHIIGAIAVDAAYYGEKFRGEIDRRTNLPAHYAP